MPEADPSLDALRRLRRWQAATVALVLIAIGGQVRALLQEARKPAPGLDRAAVTAIVREALSGRPAPEAPVDLAPLALRVDQIEAAQKALREALEASARTSAAASPSGASPGKEGPLRPSQAHAVRVVDAERRTLVRIRAHAQGGLEWRELPLGAAEAGPFPAGDDASWDAGPWTSVPAGERRLRIPLPRLVDAPPRGVLFAAAIVRAEKDVGEDQGAPNRLQLAAVEPSGARRVWDLAGQFTPVRGATRDALSKVAANTAAFAVAEGTRLELDVDAEALARRLAGALDIFVRQGPLIQIPEAE